MYLSHLIMPSFPSYLKGYLSDMIANFKAIRIYRSSLSAINASPLASYSES